MPDESSPRADLRDRRLRPQIAWGQNFLTDDNLRTFIVRSADLSPRDYVLEVGPGTGALTEKIIASGAEVLAVEIDRGLAALGRDRFGAAPNFRLLEGDILRGKNALNPEVMKIIAEHRGERNLKCVANLPYSAGTPFIANLFRHELPWASAVFLLQYEVAARILAAPGAENYGALSVGAALAGTGEILRRVPPEVFYPRPNVFSAIVKFNFLPAPERLKIPGPQLDNILRAIFGARRKTLNKALRGLFPPESLAAVLAQLNLSPAARGETLSPATMLALAEELRAQVTH